MARPRIPTAVKKLQGTLQKCRTNENEPEPSGIKPVCPADLPERGQEFFDLLVSRMELCGYGHQEHTEIIALAAQQMSLIDTCNGILEATGLTYTTSNSFGDSILKEHPTANMRHKAQVELRNCLTQLGLTPSTASKIIATKKAPVKVNKFAA
jgi:P27 family predicted phage terminase small subunit